MNVLCNPAFNPLGGSLVTLIAFYNNPNGNFGWGSHVIHNLKSGWILALGLSVSIISFINFNPKWQF